MPAYKRNLLVGATVIVALVIFGIFILQFGKKSAELFSKPQIAVEFHASQVDGLADGSNVTYRGVSVGRVVAIQRNPDGRGIVVSTLIDIAPPVPTNVDAVIQTTNFFGGTASIVLQPRVNAATGVEELPVAGAFPTSMNAQYVGLKVNLLPPEYSNTASQIALAAAHLAALTNQLEKDHAADHVNDTIVNLNTQITKAGQTLDNINAILGTDKTRMDLTQTIAYFHQASDNLSSFTATLPRISDRATTILDNTQEVTHQMGQTLTRANSVLDDLHDITTKLDKGQGTAGMLINDPKLYKALVDAGKTLDQTLLDLQRLVQQWEQEGLGLKLK